MCFHRIFTATRFQKCLRGFRFNLYLNFIFNYFLLLRRSFFWLFLNFLTLPGKRSRCGFPHLVDFGFLDNFNFILRFFEVISVVFMFLDCGLGHDTRRFPFQKLTFWFAILVKLWLLLFYNPAISILQLKS